MKILKYLSILFSLSLFVSCNSPKTVSEHGGTVVILSVSSFAEGETPDSVFAIMSKRVQAAYSDFNPVVLFDSINNEFRIELPQIDSTEIDDILFTAHGEFWIMEIIKPLEFFKYSNLTKGQKDSIIVYEFTFGSTNLSDLITVKATDTARVMNLLRSPVFTSVLPRDYNFLFVWGRPFSNDQSNRDYKGMLPLYVLKKSNANLMLSGGVRSSEVPEGPNRYQLNIKLKNENARKFETLTTKNVGNALAILLDDVVVSAPTVQQAISGGSLVISGDFDFKNASAFNGLLIGGVIKSDLKIKSKEYHQPK